MHVSINNIKSSLPSIDEIRKEYKQIVDELANRKLDKKEIAEQITSARGAITHYQVYDMIYGYGLAERTYDRMLQGEKNEPEKLLVFCGVFSADFKLSIALFLANDRSFFNVTPENDTYLELLYSFSANVNEDRYSRWERIQSRLVEIKD